MGVDLLIKLGLEVGHRMLVDLLGHLRCGMAKPLHGGLCRYVESGEDGCVIVAKVVYIRYEWKQN